MNKIAISDAARASYVAKAREVWEENDKGTYGQDMDCVTKLRLLREIDPRMALESEDGEGELDKEQYALLVQFMKLGSNAHAINVDLNQLGGAKKTAKVVEYAAIS